MKHFLILMLLYTFHMSAFAQSEEKPRNIVLLIGDGMGVTQISAAMYHHPTPLHMERFPVIGLMKTHSADSRVTDSAAAGTALASGVKTYNGGLGVTPDTLPVQSILEELNLEGFTTGLVATCYITHATPGAFFAHQKSRNLYEDIATDLLKTDIDLFIGGGRDHFDKRENDERNLVKELEGKGYHIADIANTSMDKLDVNKIDKLGYFTAGEHPKKKMEGRDWLPDATSFSLDFLKAKSDKGFFVMIESSQIDWAGHDNDITYNLTETLDFDEAIGRALDFAQRDKETLVIVLADHETGGLGLKQVNLETREIDGGWTTGGHTATMVAVMAYGPGSHLFGGIYDNTDVHKKIKQLMLGK